MSLLVAGREMAGRPIELGRTDVTGVLITVTDTVTEMAGTVRDQQEHPRVRVKVLAFARDPTLRYRLTWSPARIASTLSNDDGTYRLTGLLPGDYLVTALSGESEPWSVPVTFETLARSGVSVTLQPGQTRNVDLKLLR